MALFTVFIRFEDHSDAIWQCDVDTPMTALRDCLAKSEALANFDKNPIYRVLDANQPDAIPLDQSLENKGIWAINFGSFMSEDGLDTILGGYIIQTDPVAVTSPSIA